MKDKLTAGLLAFFTGGLGIHKFYLGDTKKGVLYACLCWTGVPGILALIDGIKLLSMSEEEFNATYNSGENASANPSDSSAQSYNSSAQSTENRSSQDIASTLMEYKKLFDAGLITLEEFQQLKQKALS